MHQLQTHKEEEHDITLKANYEKNYAWQNSDM